MNRQILLKFNTMLTGIIAFIAMWLWNDIRHNATLLIRIDERQQAVLREIPVLHSADTKMQEDHMQFKMEIAEIKQQLSDAGFNAPPANKKP